jgi:hypothetical protein
MRSGSEDREVEVKIEEKEQGRRASPTAQALIGCAPY